MGASRDEWLRRFSAALGQEPPTDEECEALLALAGVAAHASERSAAPLSTWLAGRAGLSAEEARRVASEVADDLAADAPAERTDEQR